MKHIYNGSADPEWLVKAVGPQAEGSNPSTPQLRYRFITGFIFFNYTPYGARAIGLLGSEGIAGARVDSYIVV